MSVEILLFHRLLVVITHAKVVGTRFAKISESERTEHLIINVTIAIESIATSKTTKITAVQI